MFAFLQHLKSTFLDNFSNCFTFLMLFCSIFFDRNKSSFSGKGRDLQYCLLKIYLTATSAAIHFKLQLPLLKKKEKKREGKSFLVNRKNETKPKKLEEKMFLNGNDIFPNENVVCDERGFLFLLHCCQRLLLIMPWCWNN